MQLTAIKPPSQSAVGPRRNYRHPRYLIYPLNQRRLIFNETGTDNENGTLTGAHLTSKLHLHLPKPLVELPTTV